MVKSITKPEAYYRKLALGNVKYNRLQNIECNSHLKGASEVHL